MNKLTVHKSAYDREGFYRGPYERKSGTDVKGGYVGPAHIKATTYETEDRGLPGKGPTGVLPKLVKGRLGINFSMPVSERHKIEKQKAGQLGEKSVMGMLSSVAGYNTRTNPEVKEEALADKNWVAGSFVGKKYVGFPKGFRGEYK